jgi:hypothetical protein
LNYEIDFCRERTGPLKVAMADRLFRNHQLFRGTSFLRSLSAGSRPGVAYIRRHHRFLNTTAPKHAYKHAKPPRYFKRHYEVRARFESRMKVR